MKSQDDKNSYWFDKSKKLLSGDKIVIQSENGKYRDFTLNEYEPLCDPENQLHNGTLLRYLLRLNSIGHIVWPLIEHMQDKLGKEEIVWGAKWTEQGFHSFELYFYNRNEPRPLTLRSFSALSDAFSPYLRVKQSIDEDADYTLVSFDLSVASVMKRLVAGSHIYFAGGTSKRRQESFSYGVSNSGLCFENHYTWYQADWEYDELEYRLSYSAYAYTEQDYQLVLPEHLSDCYLIHYATKKGCDGLYFSRITTEQLLWFAQKYLTRNIFEVFDCHKSEFSHILWDAGFDFTRRNNCTYLGKFGIYGTI